MRNGVAGSRLTDLGAISAACTVTIGAAKVCHCADIYTGTERGVVGAGFNFIMVANDFGETVESLLCRRWAIFAKLKAASCIKSCKFALKNASNESEGSKFLHKNKRGIISLNKNLAKYRA